MSGISSSEEPDDQGSCALMFDIDVARPYSSWVKLRIECSPIYCVEANTRSREFYRVSCESKKRTYNQKDSQNDISRRGIHRERYPRLQILPGPETFRQSLVTRSFVTRREKVSSERDVDRRVSREGRRKEEGRWYEVESGDDGRAGR